MGRLWASFRELLAEPANRRLAARLEGLIAPKGLDETARDAPRRVSETGPPDCPKPARSSSQGGAQAILTALHAAPLRRERFFTLRNRAPATGLARIVG